MRCRGAVRTNTKLDTLALTYQLSVDIVGKPAVGRQLIKQIQQVAASDRTVDTSTTNGEFCGLWNALRGANR